MRYHEISSGFRVPVHAEEQQILDRFDDERLYNAALDEREREVARLMVSRGILDRRKDDKGMYFTKNDLSTIWRL